MHDVVKVAHRGGSSLAPENTLVSFQAGIDHGADQLELDIHLSSEGEIIIMHDPRLKQTTGEIGQISDYSLAKLKTFNAAATHKNGKNFGFVPIPTLGEVLDLVVRTERPIDLQIEIKVDAQGRRYAEIEEKLISLLSSYHLLNRTIVISFDFPSLETIKQLAPGLRTGALVSKAFMTQIGDKGPREIARQITALGANYLSINHIYLTETIYGELRAVGLGVGVWTVNDASLMKKLAAMGVDFIASDRPDMLYATLGQMA